MTEDSGAGGKSNGGQGRIALVALALAAALLIGAVAGAFAYREWKTGSAAVAVGADGDRLGPGNRYPAQFETSSMYPRFSPDRRYYVTRCAPADVEVEVQAREGTTVAVAGYPPTSGRFMAEARPLPGQDFEIEVAGSGTSVDGTYRVRCLPSGFPKWYYNQFRKPPRGTFVVAFRPEPKDFTRAWVIAFDQDGTPRWWFSPDFNVLLAQMFDDGTFQWSRGFGDGFGQDSRGGMELMKLDGTPLKTFRTIDAPVDGHEFLKLDNGNYLVVSYKPEYVEDVPAWGIERKTGLLTGEIQEVTPDGRLVWRWNSLDHIGVDEVPRFWRGVQLRNPKPDLNGINRYDYFHLNSVQPWRGQLVISARHTNAVFGISRKTGEVLWKLGGTQTPKSLKVIGPEPLPEDPFSGNHDARIDDGNLLTIHENGTRTQRAPRLVRYRLDLAAGTATFESEVDDPAAPQSKCCGSARRFGDGWLVSWGNTPFVSGFDAQDRIAFRLRLPNPTYRAMPVPPGVTPLELDRALDAAEPDEPLGDPVTPLKFRGRPAAG